MSTPRGTYPPFRPLGVLLILATGIALGAWLRPMLDDPTESITECLAADTGQGTAFDACTSGLAVSPAATPMIASTPLTLATPIAGDVTILQAAGTIGTSARGTSIAWCEPEQTILSGGHWLDHRDMPAGTATPGAGAPLVTASRPVSALGAEGELIRQGWEISVDGVPGGTFTVYALCLSPG